MPPMTEPSDTTPTDSGVSSQADREASEDRDHLFSGPPSPTPSHDGYSDPTTRRMGDALLSVGVGRCLVHGLSSMAARRSRSPDGETESTTATDPDQRADAMTARSRTYTESYASAPH
ncbi:hypothetical protein I316_06919 [Kwoniella heveanensis BCC8398]|uniref:Uncharacterized protein n=1 Tax=Kwoniella heveanensis BCC8398 TaxID=1296120 RepID=A0A1B9GKG8_9TREE|nr:hypothetical protein I316_06919 [Kwoniella heveanensis BCC8398]